MKYISLSMFSRRAPGALFPCVRRFGSCVGECLIIALIGQNALAAAVNDDINDATVVSMAPYTNTVDTATATMALDDPYSCAIPYRTVWYEYTPMRDVQIEANTFGSGYDTVLSAFTGTRGSLSMLACNDDTIGTQSEITFTAQAGQTDYFMIGSYSTNGGALVFSLREFLRPVNDDFSNATVISALPFTNQLDTSSATIGAEDPYFCNYPNRTVWYVFTAPHAERVRTSVAASDYGATLEVLTGAPGKFVAVACGSQSQAIFDALAAQTYYFLAGSADTNAGHLVLTVEELIPPPNDDFSAAAQVTSLPYTDTVNTTTASAANDDPYACITPSHTVWYALTPNRHTRIKASISGTDHIGAISVFTGSRVALYLVACSSGTDSQQSLSFDAETGQTYHLLVGSSGDGGGVVVSLDEVLRPPNDDIDNAIAVTALPSTNIVDMETATSAPDDPTGCGQFSATVWYSLTPTQDMFILGEFQSGFPLQIALYSGTRGALQQVSCGSAGFAVLAGRTYYLLLGAPQGTLGGQVSFTLRDYPLFKIGLSVDSAGSIDSRTGLATLRGTVTSSLPVTVYLSGAVTQKSGRFRSTSASFGDYPGFIPVQCPGEASWSVQVLGETIPFGAGATLVSVTAVAFEPASGQQESMHVTQTVQLKGAKK